MTGPNPLVNLCQLTTATTGTGTITLGAASSGYRGTSALTNGTTYSYSIIDGTNYELGQGAYTSSGTTLARGPVQSSSANAAITLSGTAIVIVGDALAWDISAFKDAAAAPSSPTEGDRFFDNTSGINYTYITDANGSQWVETSATGAASNVYTKTTFTATAGQTSFTLNYNVGYVDVYLNGVKLTTSDYTASNGTSVVLGVAAALNDIVETVAWTTWSATNTAIGAGTGTSLALNGATLGANALAVTGTAAISGAVTLTTPLATSSGGTGLAVAIPNYVGGLTLSTAGSSATFGIATGGATDTTNAVIMALTSAYTKTTSAWAVGTGNGSLDTGTIAVSTWYHVYIIQSTAGVVDVLISTSATSPTLPSGYSYKRRIGSMRTNGSSQWYGFTQVQNNFTWAVPVDDWQFPALPGSATLKAMTVPTSINVVALLNVALDQGNVSNYMTVWSPSQSQPTTPTLVLLATTAASPSVACQIQVLTNTSAQVYVVGTSTVGWQETTLGWTDFRGS